MDGGGRLAGPLIETALSRADTGVASGGSTPRRGRRGARPAEPQGLWHRFEGRLDRAYEWLARLPRHAGVASAILIVAASAGYGTVRGGHLGAVLDVLRDLRDMAANAVGFNIATVALSGQKHVNREEILATAGVTGRASLLFFDVADARARLLTNPWISEATVQKLLPDRLLITISERQPFALWQKSGRVGVVAGDGTVLEPYVMRRYSMLPHVVGTGAETRAKDFLATLDRYPDIRANMRTSVLVAERRWNLWLKNGVEVMLPELDVERALDQLAGLERDVKLSSRDITIIDLRLPDRVAVRLSEAAFLARDEAIKKKQQAQKPKGGNA
jgi:cell division protein FtsQ